MYFRQFQLPCLSLFSYLVGDETTGRAVVVDPQRDIDCYIEDAAAHGLTIERVIETHFHADFLSGHLELQEATGAVISYGDAAVAEFPIEPLAHGQVLSLGEVTLEIRHTPGHTPESIVVVVREHPGEPPAAVLTGDTLFIGDVGRPDLVTSAGWSADALARELYRSLHDQLLTLPDATAVYPAHGAGSACGKALDDATSSTIGIQRRFNYALAPMDEDRFVHVLTDDLGAPPLYFPYTADANKRARPTLDPQAAAPVVDADRLLELEAEGAMLVDTRPVESFASAHVRGSVNVGLDGRFAEYAGDVIEPDRPIVLLGERGAAAEGQLRLARIGFDRVAGVVDGVEELLVEHPGLARRSQRVAPHEAAEWIAAQDGLQIVDVRGPGEIEASGAFPGARNLPIARLADQLGGLDPKRPVFVLCAGGYRSSAAASLMRSRGFATVVELLGGYGAWETVEVPAPA